MNLLHIFPFFCPPVHLPLEELRAIAKDGLFTAYSEEPNWGKAHRIVMPAFSPIGVRGMFDQMFVWLGALRTGCLDRRRGQHDAADARYLRALRLRLSLQQFLVRRDAPLRRHHGRRLAGREARARGPKLVSNLMLSKARQFDANNKLMREVADDLSALLCCISQ